MMRWIIAAMAAVLVPVAAAAQQGAHPYAVVPAERGSDYLAENGFTLHDSMSTPSGHIITVWCHEERDAGVLMVFIPNTDTALAYQPIPVCDPDGDPA